MDCPSGAVPKDCFCTLGPFCDCARRIPAVIRESEMKMAWRLRKLGIFPLGEKSDATNRRTHRYGTKHYHSGRGLNRGSPRSDACEQRPLWGRVVGLGGVEPPT